MINTERDIPDKRSPRALGKLLVERANQRRSTCLTRGYSGKADLFPLQSSESAPGRRGE